MDNADVVSFADGGAMEVDSYDWATYNDSGNYTYDSLGAAVGDTYVDERGVTWRCVDVDQYGTSTWNAADTTYNADGSTGVEAVVVTGHRASGSNEGLATVGDVLGGLVALGWGAVSPYMTEATGAFTGALEASVGGAVVGYAQVAYYGAVTDLSAANQEAAAKYSGYFGVYNPYIPYNPGGSGTDYQTP